MIDNRIGVIGLGSMGRGIARNYQKSASAVMVWDIDPQARQAFGEMPGVEVATPGEMAASCAMIVFVVPASPDIASCLDGPDGVLALAAKGLVIYDLTTSDPAATKVLAARAADLGIAYLDAGMSGGASGADAGSLTLMVGGDKSAFERTRSMLDPIAKQVFYLGDSGAGHTMKLIHNMVCHTIFLATCEGGQLAKAAGIELADMIKVFNAANARSYASEVRFPRHIVSGTWDARSRVYNLQKDVAMAMRLAEDLKAKVPLGSVTDKFLEAAISHGMAETDFSQLYPQFEPIVGLIKPDK